jgi:hypothetical protein
VVGVAIRVASALLFGAAVAVAQATAFVCTLILSSLGADLSPWIGVPMLILGAPLALGGAPLLVHNAFQRTRWAPTTTLRRTILSALGGMALGQFLGAVFLETGEHRGNELGSAIGAFLGCLILVSAANLRAPQPGARGLGLLHE